MEKNTKRYRVGALCLYTILFLAIIKSFARMLVVVASARYFLQFYFRFRSLPCLSVYEYLFALGYGGTSSAEEIQEYLHPVRMRRFW